MFTNVANTLLILLALCQLSASAKCCAFRLDDIQDGWIVQGQEAVINVFTSNHQHLTIGVISNYYGPQIDPDPTHRNFVKAAIATGLIEIASHGYNHEDFTTFTASQQRQLLANSRSQIYNTTGKYPTTFMPPYNAWNTNTITAMTRNGFNLISSEEDLDPPPYSATVQHWPVGVDTSFTDASYSIYYPQSADVVFAEIQAQFARDGYCAVMIHPMEMHVWDATVSDYGALNQTAVNMVNEVVTRTVAAGYTLTTLGGLPACVGANPTFSATQCTNTQDCNGFFANSCTLMACTSGTCECNDP